MVIREIKFPFFAFEKYLFIFFFPIDSESEYEKNDEKIFTVLEDNMADM